MIFKQEYELKDRTTDNQKTNKYLIMINKFYKLNINSGKKVGLWNQFVNISGVSSNILENV